MSLARIRQYNQERDELIRLGGSAKEGSVRSAFSGLLDHYGRKHNLKLIHEYGKKTAANRNISIDGALIDALTLPRGYWEAKDEDDNLEREIDKKFAKGYPVDNILFEDGSHAILYQNGERASKIAFIDEKELDKLLERFVAWESPEIAEFNRALERFKQDVPAIVTALRDMINKAALESEDFKQERAGFLTLCKESIGEKVSEADVNEMLVQHILTEDIFLNIFNDSQYHQENNVAKSLKRLEETFFTGSTKRTLLDNIRGYYQAIRTQAARIDNHKEKQNFLKRLYENFYRAYNPKGADRLGVVYTPTDVVNFMIKSVDWLLEKHFDTSLANKGVEILDPACGTGTFVCDLIEYLSPNPKALEYKYKHEIFCNEVAILPYYIANLNIEATYRARTGKYAEFENICFVDTLDNIGGLKGGTQDDLFGAVSAENAQRIKRQNQRKLSVIIGNPPYNANQMNYNDQNANTAYNSVDGRIKETYVAESSAQKTKTYDMYVRFFRWASDRLHNDGILAFVSNRSFLDATSFDGFRKSVAQEFSAIYVLDLHSDVRANPKISGTSHNVFGIQTGVAISFLIKEKKSEPTKPFRIYYAEVDDFAKVDEKLGFLHDHTAETIIWERLTPDAKGRWLNRTDNDFDKLPLPLISKTDKAGQETDATGVFKLFSLGMATNRDEWAYDFNPENLAAKVNFFIESYERTRQDPANPDKWEIKISRELEDHMRRGHQIDINQARYVASLYRPFVKKMTYFDPIVIHCVYRNPDIWGACGTLENIVIGIKGGGMEHKNFVTYASVHPIDLQCLPNGQCLPLYRYQANGERVCNITPWAIKQFNAHYNRTDITPGQIFAYVYAALHHPKYLASYGQNLKQEFPRLPFYPNFNRLAAIGQTLLSLHTTFEQADPYPLKRVDLEPKCNAEGAPIAPRVMLKADKPAGIIHLDDLTQLEGVPSQAYDYRLGSNSALEWVLDQYKEKKIKDPTVAAKFNTYRFANYKESVANLLARLVTVSLETLRLKQELAEL